MTDRETRLRERIDELTDQRDQALLDVHLVREERDSYRQMVGSLRRQLVAAGAMRRKDEATELRARLEQLRRELEGERFMRKQAQAGLREGGTPCLEEGIGEDVVAVAPVAAFAESELVNEEA